MVEQEGVVVYWGRNVCGLRELGLNGPHPPFQSGRHQPPHARQAANGQPPGSKWNPTSHLIHKCIAISLISVYTSITRDLLQVDLRVPEDSLEPLNSPANAT